MFEARDRAGVTIVDAEIIRRQEPDLDEDGPVVELVLDVLCGGEDLDPIVDWAALVGYERVWLPDGIVHLEGWDPGLRVETRCTGCRNRLVDGSRDFWAWVHSRGYFPMMCLLCGADLPQWEPVRERARRRVELVRGQASGELVDLPVSDRRAG
jgi:hypothetical protein